ncbi:hypothetical protein RhoFasB10_02521 [Rhodococcus sp. B10]|nr:hypothetical protein [Rhodococcus sp. B10]
MALVISGRLSGSGRRVCRNHARRDREFLISHERRTHNLRHLAAGTAWILSFAYLLAEVFTAAAWKTPYSFARDSISSLGVTTCDVDSCSPMHDVMNSSFIVLGALTLVGAVFLHRHIRSGREKKWILSLAVVIAVSTAATGLFPANDGTIVHWTAVLPGFIARHVVLVLIAWHLWHERRLVAVWSAVCAAVGVVGAILMVAQTLHFGLGERLALYPMPTWMAVTGTAVLFALARRTVLARFDFTFARDPRRWIRRAAVESMPTLVREKPGKAEAGRDVPVASV